VYHGKLVQRQIQEMVEAVHSDGYSRWWMIPQMTNHEMPCIDFYSVWRWVRVSDEAEKINLEVA
jgi:hypothetical protein